MILFERFLEFLKSNISSSLHDRSLYDLGEDLSYFLLKDDIAAFGFIPSWYRLDKMVLRYQGHVHVDLRLKSMAVLCPHLVQQVQNVTLTFDADITL